MGFDDSDFEKAEKVNSNTQLYKQAGNSIVVNVLERILENLIDKEEHIRILELFGGIGACSKALERLGIDYEIADYVEIDKYAVASFNAMHNTNFEPQDITTWDKDIEVDLIMHGSPCQDFSLAGKQQGGDEGSGTRSSLMYETVRIVEKLKPKYVIWENVKNVISKKHRHNFDNYLNKMEELGYKNYWQVLNAKDYGIPQNRERVFTVSIRKDYVLRGTFWRGIDDNDYEPYFVFPPKQELKLKLKDLLENNVDEKYYLSDKMVNFFYKDDNFIINHYKNFENNNGYIPDMFNPYNEKEIDDVAPTQLTTCGSTTSSSSILIKNATKQGYLEATEGDGIDISSRMKYHRGNVQKDSIQTITTSGGNDRGVVVKDKIDLSCLD